MPARFPFPSPREWHTPTIVAPDTTDYMELLRLLQRFLDTGIVAVAVPLRDEDDYAYDLGNQFVMVSFRVTSMIASLEASFCRYCRGPAHLHGQACIALPPALPLPALNPQLPAHGAPVLPPAPYLADVMMVDPAPMVAFNPDGTFVSPPLLTHSVNARRMTTRSSHAQAIAEERGAEESSAGVADGSSSGSRVPKREPQSPA
ncbi:hypothetical protein DXG01_005818 [Tephrocybe rancida]|nr:hypothetical protein DXG01_005818 [Tephrocybe rancida]